MQDLTFVMAEDAQAGDLQVVADGNALMVGWVHDCGVHPMRR